MPLADPAEELAAWVAGQGVALYPHQEEALLELATGSHVVLGTPTGSGKSLVATGAIQLTLAAGGRSFYTAPIKALVNEKFFALCDAFGPERVGMLTGDAAVNADAPVIACTAEVLANIALREGARADVALAVLDEFHYYGDPERGWAWQVPLLELTGAQFLLMSGTLGDTTELRADLTRRTGRPTALVDDAERPVPLLFSWVETPVDETLDELLATGQGPVYVVHTTRAAAVEHATRLLRALPAEGRDVREARRGTLSGFRFGPGFGRTLTTLVRAGVGVHHAGMLPKYRRLVETLAQRGQLRVICGTDTLGVGINVPIRTVLFTRLAKYDGRRDRVLTAREFHQVAGRAGRAGFDTVGYVVVQAPEHVIENERALARAGDDPRKRKKVQRRKPPEGSVVWSRQTFDKLVASEPERLPSRMRVNHAMLVNVLAREEDAVRVLRRLLMDNHEPRRQQLRLARQALRLGRSLLRSGVVTRLDEPDEHGRRFVLTVDLPEDFALDQPLAHFALAALDVLDPEAETYPLDVVSVVEAVLEPPMAVLLAQRHEARGEAVAQMKADGIEYDERMALLEEVGWPRPLAELLEAAYDVYRQTHPWLDPDALDPKSVVREMWEQGMGFTDVVGRYQLARSEGLVLRYLSDAYRTLRRTVPDAHRSPELDELVEWLGETVRQTDSSLLDEWEALVDPAHHPGGAHAGGAPAPPPRPLSAQRAFLVMVRNGLWRRVELVARDDVDALAAGERAVGELVDPPREPVLTRAAWDEALEAYYAEHDRVETGADARGPAYVDIGPETDGEPPGVPEGTTARLRRVRQTLADPAGHRDWVIDGVVDCDASDACGAPVLAVTALHRLG